MSCTNYYINEVEADENWAEKKTFLRVGDTLTLGTYCNMCKKYHDIIVIVGRKINEGSLDISIFKKVDSDNCTNMLEGKDRDPIKLNFL